ncbi:MAG: hypothetical protein MI924_27200 [Chloroflexales bacterium]|nr:hypothetical protein [Chloroflexales bacterium]
MDTSTDLRAALRAALPPALADQAAGLAQVLARVQAGQLAPDVAQQQLAPYAAALQALAGRQVTANETLLSFGAGNQIGTVSIGTVAGRDVITLHVTITLGAQRTIATDGGDYAARNIDQRQGVFVDGQARVSGPVVSNNSGSVNTTYEVYQDPRRLVTVPPGLASPLRALDAFTVDDAPLFFGRDTLIAEGLEPWQASDRRFLAVVGASGSGKSSLAQAGLIPRCSADLCELGMYADYLILCPGASPLRALRDALRRANCPVPTDFDAHLRADPTLLLNQLVVGEKRKVTLLLVDQFEELFTLCPNEAERRSFDAALCHAVMQGDGAVSILLTLRSDFYRYTADLALRQQIATYQVHVRNLSPAEMTEAIEAPVRRVAGAEPPCFAAGLVELMIAETGTSPGALPLLEFTLSRLWQAGALDLATYRQIGGVAGALNQQAEQTYAALAPPDQHAARHLLQQLVQLGEGNEDTRRRVHLIDLTPAGRTSAQTQALVQRLAAARLVTTTTDLMTDGDAAAPSVEVSHEALIRGWPRLRGWLEEDREIARLQRQISAAAHEWQASAQERSHLWTGARLVATEERLPHLDGRLTTAEQDFLAASRAEQKRRVAQQRRGRIIASVAVIASIAVIALGSLASVIWNQRQQTAVERDNADQSRQTAEVALGEEAIARETVEAAQAQVEQLQRETLSRRLAAESETIRAKQFGFAITLAIQALLVAETDEADSAVRSWFAGPLYSADSAFFHDGRVNGAAWNADASHILTWSVDGTARLWNANGALLATLPHDDRVWGAAWNADASRILTWSWDGSAKLWSANGALLATLPHNDAVNGAAWNANASRILTWSWDGSVKLWNANGALLATLPHNGRVEGAQWNTDASRILTWSSAGSVRLWNTGGELLATLHYDWPVEGAQWNADGSRILIWSKDGTAKLWNANGALLATLAHDDRVWGAAWNGNASRILIWNADGSAKLWNVSGTLLATLHHDEVNGAVWNGNASRILIWSADGSAKLWDASGSLLATLHHDDQVWGAAWNGNASRILIWSADGTARLWDVGGDLLKSACRAAGRNFSLVEWQQYMGNVPYRRTCARLPLHRSYRDDVAARLQREELSEAAAINEVARALQVDPKATGDPPAELLAEARALVAEMVDREQE